VGATYDALGAGAPNAVAERPMVRRRVPSRFTVAALLLGLGWGAHASAQSNTQNNVQSAEDPVLALIAESDRHFRLGQRELDLGHVEAAKLEFNRAVGVLLESPYGGRTEPRIREHFDRLVDRISTYEVKALAEGDGFTEKKYEAASIDALLTLSTTFGASPSTPELKNAVESDLQTAGHDIAIPLNQRVLSYIELFQGRLHDFIEEGMKRGGKYLPMIQGVFRAEGLPLDLAYVPLIESAFKPNALSRTKAKGVWQFMSGTALENGLRRDWYIDERSDPEKATIAAARYLKTLANLFSGDWHLALASYNGGPGRLQRAIKRVGVGDFWALADRPKILPRETREYVPMILAAIVIARNPAEYGFEFETDAPPDYEQVTLPRPVDLRRVAEWAGTTIDELQSLNPELRRWTTPIRAEQYELRVPAGSAERVMTRLQDTSPADLASLKWYTVKRGDTLPLIARKLSVSKTDLAEANYLPAAARVSAGQKLIVPRETTVLLAARAERTVPVADSRTIKTPPALLAQDTTGSDRVKVLYRVQRGDSLASIARLFRTSVAALRSWNKIPGARIAPGARLTIYTARAD
jgi:membrane-bound lytic murein transglycosylase D